MSEKSNLGLDSTLLKLVRGEGVYVEVSCLVAKLCCQAATAVGMGVQVALDIEKWLESK